MKRLFHDIDARNLRAAGLMAVAAFFTIFGYEIIRSSTSTLFNQAYGPSQLPWAMASMPPLLFAMILIYGKALTAKGPKRALVATILLSSLVMITGYYAVRAEMSLASGFLYVFKEAYIVVLVEQYWSFLNSILGKDALKRLSGPIIGITSIGGVLGGASVSLLAESAGTKPLLILAGFCLIPVALCAHWAYGIAGEPKPEVEEISEPKTWKEHLGLPLFQRYPSLFSLLFVVSLSQVLGTILLLQFQNELQVALPNLDAQTAFSGSYFAWTNGISFFLQFFITPFILKWVRLGFVHLFIPLVHVATAIWAVMNPSLFSAATAFMTFKCLDYSLFKAAKEVFYIPYPFDVRYRSKQIIDSFGYRFSKGATSVGLILLQRVMPAIPALYGYFCLACGALWFVSVLPIKKQLDLK